MDPHFVLSKSALLDRVKLLGDLGLKISYSYKTNREVGDILQEFSPDVDFSIHAVEEIPMIKDKSKISFFTQADSVEELVEIIKQGVEEFVVDNEIDLERILEASKKSGIRVGISLRMKFQEHRVGTGKYFVYGMSSRRVNELVGKIKNNSFVKSLGIHIHRKSQNTSEWEIREEVEDSLTKDTLLAISSLNLGGGLPVEYRSFTSKMMPYIFQKLTDVKLFLDKYNIKTVIEPGRFLAAPCIELHTQIKQVQGKNLILNTTIYNCALDNVLTGTKMLVKQEVEDSEEGEYYLIKGDSPTRDDIFRYKIRLKNPKVGDTITFLNAGAYNYTTDFFGYKKLETRIVR